MKMQSLLAGKISLAGVMAFLAAAQGFGWDQLGELKYNSHSVITNDAVLAANAALRASRSASLSNWLNTLSQKGLFPLNPREWVLTSISSLKGGFYPERHLDDGTMRSMNRLQMGNTAADWPKKLNFFPSSKPLYEAYCRFQSNQTGVGVENCDDLPNIGAGMPLHFTREYSIPEGGGKPALLPAADSCRKSVETVRALTLTAFEHWNKAGVERDYRETMRQYEFMYFFLGVAGHAIEDSFAPAHMQRDADNPRMITDICYYFDNGILPPGEAKACAHAVGVGKEPRDSIYFEGNDKYRQLATQAAQAYYTGFANAALDSVSRGGSVMGSFLDKFFMAGTEKGMGYLNCETLASAAR